MEKRINGDCNIKEGEWHTVWDEARKPAEIVYSGNKRDEVIRATMKAKKPVCVNQRGYVLLYINKIELMRLWVMEKRKASTDYRVVGITKTGKEHVIISDVSQQEADIELFKATNGLQWVAIRTEKKEKDGYSIVSNWHKHIGFDLIEGDFTVWERLDETSSTGWTVVYRGDSYVKAVNAAEKAENPLFVDRFGVIHAEGNLDKSKQA